MKNTILISCSAALLIVSTVLLAQAPTATVVVKQVQEKSIERTLPLSGRVHSRNDVEMSLTLSGELTFVAEPGTWVNAGDLLAELDERPIQLRLRETEARILRAKTNLQFLTRDAGRLETLKLTNTGSERLMDEARNQRDLAKSDLRALQVQLQQIEDELRRSKLLAAFDGVVAERQRKAGEYAQPGSTVVRLVDTADLEVRFDIPVAYRDRVTVEQGVSLRDSFTSVGQGSIYTLIPAVKENSQTLEVRARITADSNVAAGQIVEVELGIASAASNMLVPRDALVLRADGNYVYRISEANVAERIDVEIGEGEREWVTVSGELSSGDWVAVRGVERLQDGQEVVRSGT